ncbi:hypothetical protein BDC45DRAFT_533989 [Circinella umbellata]|nr:hypothetical protein BDC45DRAFT_533989 [Circinella umbellata]
MIQHRTRTLQLIFVARFKELSKHLTSHNPFYQLCNRLKSSTSPPKDPVHKVIELKRDGEYHTISTKRKTIRYLRYNRIIDSILHLPAFSRDRHRLVKWHIHWLSSYPLKNCRCGTIAANIQRTLQKLSTALTTTGRSLPCIW